MIMHFTEGSKVGGERLEGSQVSGLLVNNHHNPQAWWFLCSSAKCKHAFRLLVTHVCPSILVMTHIVLIALRWHELYDDLSLPQS